MAARALLLLAAVLALAPVTAIGEGSATPGQPPVLRGKTQPAQPPAPPAISPRSTLDSDPSTSLLTSPAPSVERPGSPGGAECRRSCAASLYLCRADRDEVDCNPVWVKCVVGCPEASSRPL